MERFEHSVLDLDFQQLAAWWELGRGGSKGQRGGWEESSGAGGEGSQLSRAQAQLRPVYQGSGFIF